jgi:DNA-binding NarL/FixJ family response regulator
MQNTTAITVLLADDHPSTLDGIRNMLDRTPDIEIIGEAEDGAETRSMLEALRPRVLLLDLQMQNFAPVAFANWAREISPQTVILVFTYHRRVNYLAQMMAAGAAGYLYKDIEAQHLIEFIRRAADGEDLFSREQLLAARQWQKTIGDKIKRLTRQELEIVKWLMKGKSNQAIAVALAISEKTVAAHLTNIFAKLQTKDRFETMLWGIDNLSDNIELYLGFNLEDLLG